MAVHDELHGTDGGNARRRARRVKTAVVTGFVGAAILAVAACTPGTITDTPHGGTPSDTSGGHDTTVVQRATLNVHIAIDDTSDARIAATAGVSVAGLTVRLTRTASTEAPRSATTDAEGNLQFTHLVPAVYQLAVERPLSATELALLAPEDREASIFAGGASLYVSPPTSVSYVGLVAARRGSIVISELYFHAPAVSGCGGCGTYGTYVELYNNSDTTIYLDGIVSFRTGNQMLSSWPNFSCSVNAAYRLDPAGLWVTYLERFPGAGRDYPLRPGTAVVWAMDAVDMSSLGLLDLSRAQFESIGGTADPDNPVAANMALMMAHYWGPHGDALIPPGFFGVALPIADTTQLERAMVPAPATGTLYSHFRIPREAILDVVGMRRPPDIEMALTSRVCEPFALPAFEHAESRFATESEPRAVSRRSLGFTPDGREILQRTHNSARDFVLANPLLRSLRK